MTTRKYLSKLQKAKLHLEQAGLCMRCGNKLDLKTEYDHTIPLALGGGNELSNWQALHAHCHKQKTNHPRGPHTSLDSDQHSIKKASRIARGGKTRKGPPIKSPGFSKTLTKGFDGTVRQRKG